MRRMSLVCGSITLFVLFATTMANADTIVVSTDRVLDSVNGTFLDLDGGTFIANTNLARNSLGTSNRDA